MAITFRTYRDRPNPHTHAGRERQAARTKSKGKVCPVAARVDVGVTPSLLRHSKNVCAGPKMRF